MMIVSAHTWFFFSCFLKSNNGTLSWGWKPFLLGIFATSCFSILSLGELAASSLEMLRECTLDVYQIQEKSVNGLMVKRKSSFYYLPNSLPIKHAFPEMRRTWFLHVEVRRLKCLCISFSPHDAVILSKPKGLMTSNGEDKARCKSEEKRIEGFHENHMQNADNRMQEEDKPPGMTNKSQYSMPENKVENLVELHANSIQGFNGIDNVSSSSISDVTSKAVHSEIEVQSKTRPHSCSKRQINSLPQLTAKTPPQVLHIPLHVDLVSKNSGDKKRGSKVGKRLLVASRSLAVSPIKRSPALSVYKFKDRNVLEYKPQINGSIFSISESDN